MDERRGGAGMKRTTITVTYGRKISLGDFNMAHLETTLSAELEDGDDPEVCTEQLWNEAKLSVKAQAIPLFKQRHDQLREIYDGLPAALQEDIKNGH
jgi:hypothetical protein